MSNFSYKFRDRRGKVQEGSLEADNIKLAKDALKNRRIKVLKISESSDDGVPRGIERFVFKDDKGQLQITLGPQMPTTRELGIFSKQFSIMISQGVPLLQSLSILNEQTDNRFLSLVLKATHDHVESGGTLSEAFAKYPAVFDELFVSMIRAGEASGGLDVILQRLTVYIEKAAKIKAQVKSALMYPAIIIVVAIGVVAALLVFVVPTFAKQFADAGQELPAITQFVVDASSFLQNNLLYILAAIAGISFVFKQWKSTNSGKRSWDNILLNAPVIGSVLQKIAVSRFCSTMSTMLKSGVSILEALQICATAAGNKVIEEFVLKIRTEVSEGSTFSDPLSKGTLFPKMVISMVAVGENTGSLDDTLEKVSEIYDEEVDVAVKGMMSMIEPALMVGIGSVVGFIVIAMYMPIFNMASAVGG